MTAQVRMVPCGTRDCTVTWSTHPQLSPLLPGQKTVVRVRLTLARTPYGNMWAAFDRGNQTLLMWLERGYRPTASDRDRFAALTGTWLPEE